MKHVIVAVALAGATFISEAADAKGCIKGAIAGGIAGHVAGNHGTMGAAAGCAVGRHQANKREQQQNHSPAQR